MKHERLMTAALISIFTFVNPFDADAGGRGMSFSRPSGGGRPSYSGGGSNWGGGNSGGGSNWGGGNGYPSSNYNSYQYQSPSNPGGGWTQPNSTPFVQPNSTPFVQPNSTPWVQSNSVTTYKPTGVGTLQVVPFSGSGPKPASTGGGLGLTTTGTTNAGSPNAGFPNGGSSSSITAAGTQGANGTNGTTAGVGGWGGKGGKGGKGKFAFAIIGGQLTRIVSSDDGSWVTADPGSGDPAVGSDGQTPVTADLSGQDPTAAITLLNPSETRGTVNFSLASQSSSLQAGYAAQATASDPQMIVFDRGGTFGQAQYTLSPGAAYRFIATDQGWDLRTVTQ
jgi:hypothetical protein